MACSLKKAVPCLVSTFAKTSRYSTQAVIKADKKLLTELRKKTGFSFFKCNEALKLTVNDPLKAEVWLKEQAEKEGWTKAAKLQGRSTNQGLIGVLCKENYAALVQVSCETDFVARNDLFQELVLMTAQATINFRQQVVMQNLKVNSTGLDDIAHLREFLIQHKIQSLPAPNTAGTIEEHVVGLVGKIGENIQVKKALAISTSKQNIIGTSSHGSISTKVDDCVMGTYGAAVVLKPIRENLERSNLATFARTLSQHVIGMNPKVICATEGVAIEDTLLGQEFLLDDSKQVGDLVKEAGVEVIDFIRYSINE